MKEIKKYLMRISTGEIIEFAAWIREGDFYELYDAGFSHEVTFGGEKWVPKKQLKVSFKDVVYILEKES